jgi:serine/threonine-protein kinase
MHSFRFRKEKQMHKIALAGLATAALVFAPSAGADVPGIAPFVGSWHAHEEGLDIQPDGNGRETYPDRSTCPDAPMAGCGKTGITDFMLTSISGDTATGTITAASDPKQPIGGPVTIKLVGDGQGLELTIAGGDQGFPFCNNNDNDAAMHYYCGA